MAVAFDGNRLSEAESETDGGTWDKWGATQSPAQDVDFPYQLGASSACIANKISNTTGGIDFDSTGTVDYTSPVRAILAQVNVTTFGLIDTTVHKGTAYQIGDTAGGGGGGSSDYYDYHLHGLFNDWPSKGGWVIVAIDPNEAGYIALTTGTPDLTIADYYGWWADITASVKSDNVMHDSLSYLAYGEGLTWTGTGGTFQDFVDEDEGTVANRWGVVTTTEGALIVTGWLNIGTSGVATTFSDTGQVIIFTESLTAEGFNGLEFNLENATSDHDITDCFLQGRGRGFAKDIFHTQSDVDDVNEGIVLDTAVDWQDLDYVDYNNEGGTDAIGLTSGNSYWIRWDSTNSIWAFYASMANAAADTTRLGLTDGTTGESHSISKNTDTRPDMTVVSTTGVAALVDGCTIDNFRNITLTADGTITACKITSCEQITQAGGVVTGCAISTATTDDGEAFIVSDGSLNLISSNGFTFSDGHAIEITATGTYTFTGNAFTGYGADASTDAALYNNSGGLVTINQSGGSGLTVRNGASASTTINNAVTIRVEVTDAAGDPVETAQTSMHALETVGTITIGDEIMNTDTNASGVAEDTGFNYEGAFDPSGLDIEVDVRKSSTGDTKYVPFSQDVVIESDGVTIFVTLAEDDVATP